MGVKKSKILFVDDEQLICDVFAEFFESEGYETSKKYSGEEAIEFLLSKEGANFDIVVTDMKMDNGDGLWLIDQINRNKLQKKSLL